MSPKSLDAHDLSISGSPRPKSINLF
jgi:hypothetical protein